MRWRCLLIYYLYFKIIGRFGTLNEVVCNSEIFFLIAKRPTLAQISPKSFYSPKRNDFTLKKTNVSNWCTNAYQSRTLRWRRNRGHIGFSTSQKIKVHDYGFSYNTEETKALLQLKGLLMKGRGSVDIYMQPYILTATSDVIPGA